uniref:Uncharacterized protein n=1 Tax=Anguilla anguilla TaxID=7936 RepID=A0A0E9S0D0_ANGAN
MRAFELKRRKCKCKMLKPRHLRYWLPRV